MGSHQLHQRFLFITIPLLVMWVHRWPHRLIHNHCNRISIHPSWKSTQDGYKRRNHMHVNLYCKAKWAHYSGEEVLNNDLMKLSGTQYAGKAKKELKIWTNFFAKALSLLKCPNTLENVVLCQISAKIKRQCVSWRLEFLLPLFVMWDTPYPTSGQSTSWT